MLPPAPPTPVSPPPPPLPLLSPSAGDGAVAAGGAGASVPLEAIDYLRNTLERHAMVFLHRLVFAVAPEDCAEDDAVAAALLRLRWLPPEALRVPEGARSPLVLRTAVHELRAINARAAPEDKLASLASACTVLYKALAQHARRTAGAGAQPASADDFLPALIYTVLQAAPPRLVSNIAYIERFRDGDQLLGVAGYCLTNLRSCMQYLRTLDAAALNMDAAAFDARCAAAAAGRAPAWLDTV